MIVPPTMVIDPSQSIALRPASKGVLGASMSRKNTMITKASPSNGTARRMSISRHEGVRARTYN